MNGVKRRLARRGGSTGRPGPFSTMFEDPTPYRGEPKDGERQSYA